MFGDHQTRSHCNHTQTSYVFAEWFIGFTDWRRRHSVLKRHHLGLQLCHSFGQRCPFPSPCQRLHLPLKLRAFFLQGVSFYGPSTIFVHLRGGKLAQNLRSIYQHWDDTWSGRGLCDENFGGEVYFLGKYDEKNKVWRVEGLMVNVSSDFMQRKKCDRLRLLVRDFDKIAFLIHLLNTLLHSVCSHKIFCFVSKVIFKQIAYKMMSGTVDNEKVMMLVCIWSEHYYRVIQ